MADTLPVDAIIQSSGGNDYSDSPFLKRREDIGTMLVCSAAADKKLEVKYHRGLIYEVSDGGRRVVFRQNSPQNSAVYTYCARQKHIAKAILARHGVPVPSGEIFEDYAAALGYFRASNHTVTVKPCDGSSGHGVTSGVTSEREFETAWQCATQESRKIIVEQNIVGQDVRVIVIGGQAEAAYVREPAHVIGDGKHSIRELVDDKNRQRVKNPGMRYDMLKRFDLLERDGISLSYVPKAGEKIQLTSVANASAGGETVQILDHLDRDALEIAERAARCFPGLVQVGVDLMYLGKALEDGEPPAYVIEVNSNPGICDAVFPCYGRPVDVPGKLLSHVFSQQPHVQRAPFSLALAPLYGYQHYPKALYRGVQRQVDLIQQAAFGLGLRVETISESVFSLHSETRRCMFHGGMPEGIPMVSRKITRNREWMAEVLPACSQLSAPAMVSRASPQSAASPAARLKHYRLLVVGGRLIAALEIESQGDGTSRKDVSDLVHESVLPILQATLEAIFDPCLAGVDLLAENISTDMQQQLWRVDDAVCNPILGLHHFPDQGPGRDVSRALVQALFPELPVPPVARVCERLLISGQVQGVGFRRWLKLMAIRHSVSGWVRNRPDGQVEAIIEGTPSALRALTTLCSRGSTGARVDAVLKASSVAVGRTDFTIL
ncbi:acylphosphatase [Microbulbifer sp. SA54]|uniref:acylphosphatase n=1 Tax=Microbulbifer sp. SA54 TaxID=3401577 RepID=UPI003AAF8B37